MDELQELYREVILDHNRKPRNFGELPGANHVIEAVNPLCGDKLTLYVNVADGRVADIRFKGTGCAISVASSSLMTERVKGQTVGESTSKVERPQTTPITPIDLKATVLHALGLPLNLQFTSPLGRPTYMIEGGRPIRELV